MEIPFLRVGATPTPVTLKCEIDGLEIQLSGELKHHEKGLILLAGRLTGKRRLECDRCAVEYEALLDEPVELLLASGIFENPEEEERFPWPVMEMLDGKIDLDAVLQSELAAFECGYHRCPECEAGPKNFELTQGE